MSDDPGEKLEESDVQEDAFDPSIPSELGDELQDLDLPEEVIRRVLTVSARFSGPLPHPSHLKLYDEMIPGSADRIISLAEKQTSHRQKIEMKITDAQIEDQRSDRRERFVGQLFGLLIGLATVLAGSLTAVYGNPWAGGFIGVSGVTGLVSVFVVGKSKSKQEPEEKSDD